MDPPPCLTNPCLTNPCLTNPCLTNPCLDYVASVHDIFKEAKEDPALKSQINMEQLLKNANNSDVKSLDTITKEVLSEIKDIFTQTQTQSSQSERHAAIKEMYAKLKEYRVINEIFEIHRGKHVRWIRRQTGAPKLTNGGIIIDVKFLDTGTHILVKCGKRFIQIKYDDCVIFQKLSDDEQILFMGPLR